MAVNEIIYVRISADSYFHACIGCTFSSFTGMELSVAINYL